MGGAWLEGSCPISLSVTQNNCWLVAESNLEKKNTEFDSKVSLSIQKLQNEIRK